MILSKIKAGFFLVRTPSALWAYLVNLDRGCPLQLLSMAAQNPHVSPACLKVQQEIDKGVRDPVELRRANEGRCPSPFQIELRREKNVCNEKAHVSASSAILSIDVSRDDWILQEAIISPFSK